jgi:hypothetical protein
VLDNLAVFKTEYFVDRQATFSGMADHIYVEKNVISVCEALKPRVSTAATTICS